MGTMTYSERRGQGITLILGKTKNVGRYRLSVMLISHQPIKGEWGIAEE